MIAGVPPIRAKKARYFEDARLTERVLPAPALNKLRHKSKADDWSTLPLPPRIESADTEKNNEETTNDGSDDDPIGAGFRQQAELDEKQTVEKKELMTDEFTANSSKDQEDRGVRLQRSDQFMQKTARQVAFDRGDGMM